MLAVAVALLAPLFSVLSPTLAAAAPGDGPPAPTVAPVSAGPDAATGSPGDPVGTATAFGQGVTGNHAMAAGTDGYVWFGTDRGLGRVGTDGTITVYPSASPYDMETGPDGTVWFTSAAGLQRVTPGGTVAAVPGAPPGTSLASGADGDMWISAGTSISRITAAGVVTTFTDPALVNAAPIAYGAGGNIWFTDYAAHAVGRMTTDGVVTMFPDDHFAYLGGITAGADGNIWVTAFKAGTAGWPPFIPPTPGEAWLVRVDAAGAMTFFAKGSNDLGTIISGPGGDLWFAYQYPGSRYQMPYGGVARSDTNGQAKPAQGTEPGHQLPLQIYWPQSATGGVNGLAAGADGNIWSVSSASNAVNRIAADGGPLISYYGTGVNHPTGIALDAQGNAWFANNGTELFYPVIAESRLGSIGRSTGAGEVTGIRSDKLVRPKGVTRASDGSMWFTDGEVANVIRVGPYGGVTAFPTNGNGGGAITTGADGNVWIASGNGVQRITPGGVATRFALSTTEVTRGIAGGPDGNVWFATGTTSIGRITPAGAITTFPSPRADLTPDAITSGPDGNLWFTNQGGTAPNRAIGRITTNGTFTYFTDPGISTPLGITGGPDGNIWFTNAATTGEPNPGAIARVTSAGGFTYFTSPSVPEANGIAAGPGGELWFTMNTTNALGRMQATAPGAPNPAAFPAATSRPDGARVTWWPTAPAVGATGGFVTPYRNGVALTPTPFTGSPASAIVAGLTYGETYRFTISVTNASGTGPPSPLTAPITVGAPIAPAFVAATSTAAGATVSWWSQPVTSGVITPYLGGVAQSAIPFAGQTSAVAVAGLTAGQTYTFTVTLTNPYGTSPPSAPTNAVVAGAAPATPVAAFPTATAGAGGVTVSWWPQPITGGTITPYLGGVAQTPIPFTGNVNSRLIAGLTVGQSYRFTITLTNANGTGPPSALTAPVIVVG